MRKKSFYVWSLMAALFMTACSDQNDNINPGDTTSMEFSIDFSEVIKSRAATSATPVTSWEKSINKVQFFLLDGNTVKYSAIVDPASKSGDNKTFVYTDVPVGTYSVLAVANVNSTSDAITTTVPSVGNMEWNASNVRQKDITGLTMKHKLGSFPTYSSGTGVVPSALAAYETPSEIFMAEYSGTVTVASGTPAVLSTPLKLQREVAMMRVRLNIKDTESGTDNVNSVDWNNDVTVLIYSLPNDMQIGRGNTGGVSTSSTGTNVQVGATAFKTANPSAADYNNNTTILNGDNFEKWVDIPVFANNGGRGSSLVIADGTHAPVNQKYTIVVTAKGLTGHKLADGKTMDTDATIYWEGLIHEAFFPNYIREVNLTLKSGGKKFPIPPGPVVQGELTISVEAPEPWNTNILTVNKEL